MRRLLSFCVVWVPAMVVAQVASTPLQLPLPAASRSAATVASPVAAAPAVPIAGSPLPVPGLLNGFVPDDSYKLRVGDTVSFQITEDQVWDPVNAPKTLVVQDSGEIEMSYIGRVMAVGKTCKQLAAEVKSTLEKDYYKKATVVISMSVASPILGQVYIWGQVHNQGALNILVNENLTAGQAIMRAGGFADFANESKVKVIRNTTGPGGSKEPQTINLDMKQILDKGKTDKDVMLQPGDLIIVPSRLINF